MYHCHMRIYFVGRRCREFEIMRKMPPLEFFTHECRESEKPENKLMDGVDAVFVSLQEADTGEILHFFEKNNRGAKIVLLAGQAQIRELGDKLTWLWDIWTLPMTEEEVRFRFLRWQQSCKTEKDFWQTSQYLEETINHVPNLIWYKDKNGIHEKVNDSFCKTVNKTKAQVQGRGHAYIWDVEQDDPACIESEREVMEKKHTFVSEESVKTGDGIRLLTTYKSPLYDLDGSVMGTVGVAIDVTQERAYEQEIIEKNRTLETIFTTMECGVMCHSVDGARILSINRAALQILGYESQDELMADGFDMVAESVVDEDKAKLRGYIQSLKREGDSVGVEYRVMHKSGEIRHVMGNVKLLRENGELLYQRFLLDCTARKLKEEENEQRQRELVQALSIDYSLVCFFDLDTGLGRTLRIDDDDNRMFGSVFEGEISLQESMEDYIQRFVNEEDQELLRQASLSDHLWKELEEKGQCYVTYRVGPEGDTEYFQMKAVCAGVWEKNHGMVLGFRSVDEEIRNEMEQKDLLEDALLQANRANQAKSAFLSNMSHDIRTPMNAIVGFTTLAISHIDKKERVEEYLQKIMTSGNHLLGLINDVLDMSRIESGKMHLEEEPCSLPELLHNLHSIIQPNIFDKQQNFSIDLKEIQNTEIYCDKLRVNQVLLNLISNSMKYTEAGGSIDLWVTEKKEALREDVAEYEFTVRDTGIGMSSEFLNHIFEPFEREKNTTISGIQGTGLGMAITKNIVDMMHGSIGVESEPGVGTEFKVCLPFRLVKEGEPGEGSHVDAEQREPESLRPGDTDGKEEHQIAGRILLAEDNELNQEIAVELLGDAGFCTEVAMNGQIAVEMLEHSEPGYYQLVLMDVQMPVMDGYEAAKAIRQLPDLRLAEIPILAMTANAFEEDRQEALRCGMNGHIAKPIDVDKLFDTLKQVLCK
ncbi:MAG: response regulator [Lachnospiraceae bacterium]|nr:response regulator [Lachnospiraceae bacterium]